MMRGLWLLLGILLGGSASSQTLDVLLTNGPTASRINVVFLSEGYTQAELAKFRTNALSILNRLLDTPPFTDYRMYFNAFAIAVASQESGSDHPLTNIFRETYFNSTYDSFGIDRVISIPPNNRDPSYANGQGKVDALLAELMPEYDVVVLVVNDVAYGGSGGEPLIASINMSSAEIAIHELGHNYAGLGDEYTAAYPGYPDIEEPNTTRVTDRALIKWNSWIADITPVPTPATSAHRDVVGLFEGAHYHATGWYRPKLDCKMRNLGQPFCEVCGEALVLSTYSLIRPIDFAAPPTNATHTLVDTQSITLAVQTLQPGNPLGLQWRLNDNIILNATNNALTLWASALPIGMNRVGVMVSDGTSRVRHDPMRRLTDSRTWRINVEATQPRLQVDHVGEVVILSWPVSAESFALEWRASLSGPLEWETAVGVPLRIGERLVLTNSIGNSSLFFRLRRR